MKLKYRNRLLAGLMSAAILMQGAAALPSLRNAKPLTAEAVSVRSIQTRVFSYDFGGFQALYDTKTARWYTTEGAEIVSQTEPVQRLENPYFDEESEYEYEHIRAFIINMTDMTLAFELRDGTVEMIGELGTAYTGTFRDTVMQILEITPEYNPQYYDKAQQLYADVPEPAGFPLTYVWRIAKAEDESDETGVSVYCDIYFGEIRYGSCRCFPDRFNFVKSADIADEGAADPFTDAGDASIDGRQDVADAVLTGRVAGEDEDTVISDLGMELADKDGDGLLTGSDATGILKDVAGITAPPDTPPDDPDSIPEGAIPVARMSQSAQPLSFFAAIDQSTGQAYTADYKETITQAMGFDGTWEEFYAVISAGKETVWCRVQEGREYDYIRLYCRPAGSRCAQFAIQSLHLDADGILNVTAGVYSYAEPDENASALVNVVLRVPGGVLPEIRGVRITGTDPDRYGTDEKAFLADIPKDKDLFLTMEPQQREAVPVIALEYPHENFKDIAKSLGYEDERTLYEEIMRMDINYQFYEHCTESETGDIWDFAYHIDDEPGFHNAALRTLTISERGQLNLDVVTYYDPDSAVQSADWLEDPMQWIQIRITVPHGALSDYVLTHNQWTFTERDAPFTASDFTQITPYTDGIRAEVQWDSEGRSADAALVPEEIRTALGDSSTAYVFRQLRDVTDTDDAGLQAILAEGREILAVYTVRPQMENTLGVMSAVWEDDTLALALADHCTERMSAAFAYHRVLLITEAGALPDINTLDVTVQNYCDLYGSSQYPAFLAAVKNPVYLHSSHITAAPAERGDGITVQCDSEYYSGGIIPEDVADELKTPADTAFRQYFEPEDTDCEDLQKILAQGKDVLAVYLLRSSGGSDFGVMRAECWRDTLNLMLAEHRDVYTTQAFEYHRVLLITEDYKLPDIGTVNVDIAQVYQDTEIEYALTDGSFAWATVDTRPDFEAAICNPVSLREYAYSCIPAQSQTALLSREAENTLAELYSQEGGTMVKLLREPADTDDPTVQAILENGTEDVLAVYFHESDYSKKFGITEIYADEAGTLHISAASQIQNPTQDLRSLGHSVLLCVEKGALPDFSDYEVTVTAYEIYNDPPYWEQMNPDYLKAVRNPVYLDVFSQPPQTRQISLRGNQAGVATVWREREDFPEVRFESGPLREDAATDTDEDDWGLDFTWKILHDYVYWQNGIPELTNGDLFCAMTFENDWRGWVGVQSAVLDGDGVLHLTVARCEGEGAYAKDDEEGDCTAVIICMLGEYGAFAAIQDVQFSYTDYDSYEAYTQAIPQNLSILLQ